MSKAYDRLEWGFITEVLSSMGFPCQMVSLISKCISSVSYSVLINGQPSKVFSPERGLRQGDPLSPYLFILCADVLSGLLKKEAQSKNIHGISVARKALVITHLFFADDSLLFARANNKEAGQILEILQRYQCSSGQMVNLEKSEVSFSRNVCEADANSIRTRMGVKTVANHSKYLGLPVVFGRSKIEVFGMVIDRVWKNLKGWKERFLSRAGKEVLIKAVAQAIPTYIMSCYKLPETTCHEIETLLAKFWWGSRDGERKVHWLSWEKLARAKGVGGLGFRGVSGFNTSLLGKHYWRLMCDDQSLVSRVFKGRYYPRSSIEESSTGYAPSYAWRSILSARELIHKGSRWRIGDGERVRIWQDRWIPDVAGFKLLETVRLLDKEAKFKELIDKDLGCWKKDLISSIADPLEAGQIESIPLSLRRTEDKLIWHSERNGEYSVRSAYHLCTQYKQAKSPGPSNISSQQLWKDIRKAPIHNIVRNFLWRLAKNILPTRVSLSKKGINLDDICPLCLSLPESAQHLFLNCEFSRLVFFSSTLCYRVPPETDICNWLSEVLSCGDTLCIQMICYLAYKIWCARNDLLFKQKTVDPRAVAELAFANVCEFNMCNPEIGAKRSSPVQPTQVSLPKDCLFLQVDAGVSTDGVVAFGCVLKKHNMSIDLVASKRENFQAAPMVAEILAIRWSLQLAKELELNRLIIQSDAPTAVDCINGVAKDAVLEPIAADCRFLLNSFSCTSVMYIRRNENVDAHNVARLGKLLGSRTWLNGYPAEETIMNFYNLSV
ncbi:uncharacterized protein LOC131650515 [Vicia villosa]|uniref:uncharacterized protein LOC131650515 n=1 Tax=Vicia villosa TaxID=3911 RepID=UPI00273C2115|nr:uncharacterized protein LOC131650515 [Vicia villosa]